MQNRLYYGHDVRERFEALLPVIEAATAGAPDWDRRTFALRFERYFPNLFESLVGPYGHGGQLAGLLEELTREMVRAHLARPGALRELDFERELTPDWFQRPQVVGYAAYVDRFAGTLRGVERHIDYLVELGIGYLHLQAVLMPREGDSDGGYAIADYLRTSPQIGTMEDLDHLAATLRARGISLCVDLVLNHCAREHAWARRARAGDPTYLGYFHTFPDRGMPDAYEATLPEVFPETAPGSFTWYEDMGRWVWTTFHEFQWDLNWSNPRIFLEMTRIMFELANRGIDVFRLDAVAFLWKRLGTSCQNQPEVHDLLQALRACANITIPAVVHKAEAIVSPDDLVHYLGTGKRYGKVSNLAYHNTLMVQYWGALASRDTRLMVHTLREFPRTPTSIAWGTYVRGHDDIGWAITDDDAAAVGLSGPLHRAFLSDYYLGLFPGSAARGLVFQPSARTGDRRVSGTLASLNGVEAALEANDLALLDFAIERILLGFALICGWGGIPILFMGDELGVLNDPDYAGDPHHRADSRWAHRPRMDWERASRRHLEGHVEARVYRGLVDLVRARKRTPHLHAQYESSIPEVLDPHVFLQVRPHPLGTLLGVYNFGEEPRTIDLAALRGHRIDLPHPFDQIDQRQVPAPDGRLTVGPYGRLWLV